MDTMVFQNSTGDLTLQFPEQIPFADALYIVNMAGIRVYSGTISANTQIITLPVSDVLHSGVYVLYSKHGYLKPCRFSFV